jgi:hypothetical protein
MRRKSIGRNVLEWLQSMTLLARWRERDPGPRAALAALAPAIRELKAATRYSGKLTASNTF